MAVSPQHVTLVASTVSTITLDFDFDFIEITNVNGVAAAYYSFDGSTPTVAGAGFFVLPGVAGLSRERRNNTTGVSVVKIISSGIPQISVAGRLN